MEKQGWEGKKQVQNERKEIPGIFCYNVGEMRKNQ